MRLSKKNIYNYLFICLTMLIAVSCSDTCGENMNAIPLAGFYEAGETVSQVAVDSLKVCGVNAPGDSVLLSPTERKSELYLPFRIDSDTTSFIFTRQNNSEINRSTVTFIYSRTPRFDSYECGVSYIFDMRKIECTGNLIDSVTCPMGFIDNTNIENLHIYFAANRYEL